jgi:hypothetical protein
MAEKKKPSKKPESHSSKGGMSFGLEVILLLVAIFIIWILGGGAKKEIKTGPFINPADIVPATPTSNR